MLLQAKQFLASLLQPCLLAILLVCSNNSNARNASVSKIRTFTTNLIGQCQATIAAATNYLTNRNLPRGAPDNADAKYKAEVDHHNRTRRTDGAWRREFRGHKGQQLLIEDIMTLYRELQEAPLDLKGGHNKISSAHVRENYDLIRVLFAKFLATEINVLSNNELSKLLSTKNDKEGFVSFHRDNRNNDGSSSGLSNLPKASQLPLELDLPKILSTLSNTELEKLIKVTSLGNQELNSALGRILIDSTNIANQHRNKVSIPTIQQYGRYFSAEELRSAIPRNSELPSNQDLESHLKLKRRFQALWREGDSPDPSTPHWETRLHTYKKGVKAEIEAIRKTEGQRAIDSGINYAIIHKVIPKIIIIPNNFKNHQTDSSPTFFTMEQLHDHLLESAVLAIDKSKPLNPQLKDLGLIAIPVWSIVE